MCRRDIASEKAHSIPSSLRRKEHRNSEPQSSPSPDHYGRRDRDRDSRREPHWFRELAGRFHERIHEIDWNRLLGGHGGTRLELGYESLSLSSHAMRMLCSIGDKRMGHHLQIFVFRTIIGFLN
jgi:hypothetical protein